MPLPHRRESETNLKEVEKLIDMQVETVGATTLATHQAVMHLLALQTNEIHHMVHRGIIDHEEEGSSFASLHLQPAGDHSGCHHRACLALCGLVEKLSSVLSPLRAYRILRRPFSVLPGRLRKLESEQHAPSKTGTPSKPVVAPANTAKIVPVVNL